MAKFNIADWKDENVGVECKRSLDVPRPAGGFYSVTFAETFTEDATAEKVAAGEVSVKVKLPNEGQLVKNRMSWKEADGKGIAPLVAHFAGQSAMPSDGTGDNKPAKPRKLTKAEQRAAAAAASNVNGEGVVN